MSFIFNPFTGNLEASQSSIIDSATKLKITRTATEAISAGELVKADNDTDVSLATANSTQLDAQVLGIAETNAGIGQAVDIILSGVVTDAAFAVFTINSPLFLDVDGGITDTKRVSGYHVVIGKSLGGSDILFQPTNPITIS